MMKKYKIIFLLSILLPFAAQAQIIDTTDIMKEFDEYSFRDANPIGQVKDSTKLREHLIGVKWGMGLNNITFSMDFDKKTMVSPKNFGIYYTYYHSLWNSISLFGLEMGLQYNEEGYTTLVLDYNDKITDQGKERFQTVTFPFISQFRIDFWRMRLLANAGAFASYRFSSSFSDIMPTTITSTTKKFGYGFVLGGGLAFVFRPFEVHFEANYKYNLSNLYDKTSFYGNEYWISTHTNQLILSVGLFTRIGGSAYKVKENSPYYKSGK